MAASTIALIILLITLVLYAIPRMPLSATTLLAMSAMVIFGIIDFKTATSGFANKVLFLIVGLTILGQSPCVDKERNFLRMPEAANRSFPDRPRHPLYLEVKTYISCHRPAYRTHPGTSRQSQSPWERTPAPP